MKKLIAIVIVFLGLFLITYDCFAESYTLILGKSYNLVRMRYIMFVGTEDDDIIINDDSFIKRLKYGEVFYSGGIFYQITWIGTADYGAKAIQIEKVN